MSHIVEITTQVRDEEAVRAACRRLDLPDPVAGSTKLFSSTVEGLAVRLPAWQYPVVFELDTGRVQFDNFSGRWGDRAQLDHFMQTYALEKAKLEARKRGYSATEQALSDGSVKLTIHL